MREILLSLLLFVFLADAGADENEYNGWRYAANKLVTDGISAEEVQDLFEDFPEVEPITFKLAPKENPLIYEGVTHPKRIQKASKYLEDNWEWFKKAEKAFKVSPYIIAAIHSVETNCGEYLGKQSVAYRLTRLASISEPVNLEYNYRLMLKNGEQVKLSDLQERAAYLDSVFYPELLAVFKLKEHGIKIKDLKGSLAGAFGIPQFLPGSYLKFGKDGDEDGKIDLFLPADAIFSTANFLNHYGWKDTLSFEERLKVIWNYNRSDAYGRAVTKVSVLLGFQTKNN